MEPFAVGKAALAVTANTASTVRHPTTPLSCTNPDKLAVAVGKVRSHTQLWKAVVLQVPSLSQAGQEETLARNFRL